MKNECVSATNYNCTVIGGVQKGSHMANIEAVRDNWAWLMKLHTCARLHLQQAVDYHQVRCC